MLLIIVLKLLQKKNKILKFYLLMVKFIIKYFLSPLVTFRNY